MYLFRSSSLVFTWSCYESVPWAFNGIDSLQNRRLLDVPLREKFEGVV
jgi:hypothetical protein